MTPRQLISPQSRAALFDPPTGMTKYDNGQALIQGAMMKRFGNRPGAAPGKQGQ